ncbi:MAG: hypothetical protein D3908_05305 [Candidatus Electrothrix sp. AUS4]|nr:hypothetical protein [Candidatus Electrothrix sp. AUS4]
MESRRFITKASTSQIQIDLPDSMVNRKIEILIIALEEATDKKKIRKRRPPIELAGKVKERGNVMESAPLSDWGIE